MQHRAISSREIRSGKLLVPAGSARDMFLHVKEVYIDEAVMLLQQRLATIAEVYYTEQLIAQDFFGSSQPSKEFLARVGNVVILPYQARNCMVVRGRKI